MVSGMEGQAVGGEGGGGDMGASPSSAKSIYQIQADDPESPGARRAKAGSGKLKLIPLIFLIFFEVSGGPFGEEDAVGAAGPLFAILGFIIFPFIWSVPEALVTAELATAFPGNGGYVIWAGRAFGPFWGSLMGYWKFLSGAINNAAYPVLCADYLKLVFPVFSAGLWRDIAILVFNVLLAFLNYTGLTVVGYTAVTLGVVSLIPFLLMFFISLPRIRPARWLDLGQKGVKKDWPTFFNTLFWNLNFWDNASTLAGEVDNPQTTFPVALFAAGILTCAGYIIPLLSGTGAIQVDQRRWKDGFLADVAGMIAGKWLKYWVEAGAVLSAVGLFEAQLSSGSYQLLGTAELGFLPWTFASRSKWFGTPWVGILASSAITLGMSFMTFGTIIAAANFLYSMGMLLEFASFLWLRRKLPGLKRPYRVPMGMPGLVVMCLVPTGFLVFVMVISGKIVVLISAGLTVVGVAGYFALGWCRDRGWMEFRKRVDNDDGAAEEESGPVSNPEG